MPRDGASEKWTSDSEEKVPVPDAQRGARTAISLSIGCKVNSTPTTGNQTTTQVTPVHVSTSKSTVTGIEATAAHTVDEAKNNDFYLSILNGCLSTESKKGTP